MALREEEKKMSKLNRLMGDSEIVELNGEKFEIKPLTMKDISLFVDLGDDKKRAEAMVTLISKVMKQAVPDATDEELNNISVEYLEPLTNVIMKVNGMESKVPQLQKK